MTNDENRQVDEAIMTVRAFTPRMWWNIYQGCLEQGFNALQAMTLLQTYILGQNPSGIRPNDLSGPETDSP